MRRLTAALCALLTAPLLGLGLLTAANAAQPLTGPAAASGQHLRILHTTTRTSRCTYPVYTRPGESSGPRGTLTVLHRTRWALAENGYGMKYKRREWSQAEASLNGRPAAVLTRAVWSLKNTGRVVVAPDFVNPSVASVLGILQPDLTDYQVSPWVPEYASLQSRMKASVRGPYLFVGRHKGDPNEETCITVNISQGHRYVPAETPHIEERVYATGGWCTVRGNGHLYQAHLVSRYRVRIIDGARSSVRRESSVMYPWVDKRERDFDFWRMAEYAGRHKVIHTKNRLPTHSQEAQAIPLPPRPANYFAVPPGLRLDVRVTWVSRNFLVHSCTVHTYSDPRGPIAHA